MKKSREQKIAALSPRAKRTWDLLCKGKFYPAYTDKTPLAMAELEAASLVGVMGRVANVIACYVPAGTKPFKIERFPKVKT